MSPRVECSPRHFTLAQNAPRTFYTRAAGECKSWTLDSGLDHGLDYGLEYGLNSRLIFKLLAMVASHDLH